MLAIAPTLCYQQVRQHVGARIQKVTPRWVRELYRRYKETGEFPFPKAPGRKQKPISREEREAVIRMRKEHPVNALILEKLLKEKGYNISHNCIHKILREANLVKNEPRKQKRRKWVRYERRYSNSLWH